MELSSLACLLSKNDDDSPETLIDRALKIWAVANDKLSKVEQKSHSELISFEQIANGNLLPAAREKFGDIKSVLGIKKAIERYFENLLGNYDKIMKGRLVTHDQLAKIKMELKQLRDRILEKNEMPRFVLDLIAKYQREMRNNNYEATAFDITALLGGIDIGKPDPSGI